MSDDQFYEQNEQCWRCRMYVPRVEMKYHAGMLYCPICYQDVAETGRCQLCGKQLESGENELCRQCRERKRAEERKHKDSERRHDVGIHGTGDWITICSNCQQRTEEVGWHDGRPFCPTCLEKHRNSMTTKAVDWFKKILGVGAD
ncbi:MAG: hypothetical protein ABIG39_04600 [Candidatus Micrarchaeota archaeon]